MDIHFNKVGHRNSKVGHRNNKVGVYETTKWGSVPVSPWVPGVLGVSGASRIKTAKIRNISKVSGATYISDVVFIYDM